MNPIIDAASLPPVGSVETVSLDFKGTYKDAGAFDRFEIGKDVAALANAVGGVLLVGAQEDKSTRTLQVYKPLNSADTKDTVVTIDEAVRDRCFPAPVFNIVRIPKDHGTVLAVHVTAYPGQPVGAKVNGDKVDGYGGAAWTFPVRVGTQTNYFRPEQLAMLMLPELRRIAIALAGIAHGTDVTLHTQSRTAYNAPYSVGYISSDPFANVLTIKQPKHNQQPAEVAIPMDGIRSVWKSGGHWHIALKGQFAANDVFMWHD